MAPSHRPCRAYWAALFALLSGVAALGIVVLLQFLRTDYNPLSYDLSIYAFGPFGEWLRVALYGFAFSLVALAVVCWQALPRSVPIRFGIACLVVAGISCALAGTFTTEGYPPASIKGVFHFVGGGGLWLSWDAAMFPLIGAVWQAQRGWRRLAWGLTIGAIALQALYLRLAFADFFYNSVIQKGAFLLMWLTSILIIVRLFARPAAA